MKSHQALLKIQGKSGHLIILQPSFLLLFFFSLFILLSLYPFFDLFLPVVTCTSFWKFKIRASLVRRCLPVQCTSLPRYTRRSRCCVSKATQLPPVFFNPRTTTTVCRSFPSCHDCRARAVDHRCWLVHLRGVPVLPEWSRWKALSLKRAAHFVWWNRWQKKTCNCTDSSFEEVSNQSANSSGKPTLTNNWSFNISSQTARVLKSGMEPLRG